MESTSKNLTENLPDVNQKLSLEQVASEVLSLFPGSTLVDTFEENDVDDYETEGSSARSSIFDSEQEVVDVENAVSPDRDETYILRRFKEYCDKLKESGVILENEIEKACYYISRFDESRYSRSGQRRIEKKIKRCLGRYFAHASSLLTLTFDPGRISRVEAWNIVNKEKRRFMDTLNAYRKRDGKKKRLSYLWTLEKMPNGFPHAHIVFPGLRWVAPKEWIRECWGYGRTDVGFKDNIGVASYICKYLTKFGLDESMMSFMKFFSLRLYGLSKEFSYKKLEKKEGWSIRKVEDLLGNWRVWVGMFASGAVLMNERAGQGWSIRGSPGVLQLET